MTRYVFGFAGIPSEVYDQIYARRDSIVGANACFEGFSRGRASERLSRRHANALLLRFKGYATEDLNSTSEKSSFALLCVSSDCRESEEFEVNFFPSILTCRVNWAISTGNEQSVRESGNRLVELLRASTTRARFILDALRKEVSERESRTPLLLPLRNFRSEVLREKLLQLQSSLRERASKENVVSLIAEVAKQFEQTHPLKQTDSSNRKCFIDDKNVQFHTPGTAAHGLARPSDQHAVECFLGAYRRFGAPFRSAFHYDCQKHGAGNLRGHFYTCHGTDACQMEGDPHLNIAPNDFVRP